MSKNKNINLSFDKDLKRVFYFNLRILNNKTSFSQQF